MGKEIKRSFRTKIILVAGCGVLAGLLLSGAVALLNFINLGEKASDKIELGLKTASNEYLQNYIKTTSVRTGLMLNHAFSDLRILADFLQFLTDHPQTAEKIGEAAEKTAALEDRLSYNAKDHWFQNKPDEPAVVSVWGSLLDANHRIIPEVQKQIQDTAILDVLLPALHRKGASKLYMYYVGPRGGSFIRLAPFVDMASEFDRNYPGHNDADFWDFFFPGLWGCWESLAATDISDEKLRNVLSLTSPYEDAAGGGIIMSAFHPVWDAQRKITGVAGMDFSINNIVDMIKDVQIAQTGFAFLAQSSGNVLAVNDYGERLLGLRAKTGADSSETGISLLSRNLHQSTQQDVARLKLPVKNDVQAPLSVSLVGLGGREKKYTILMRRLPAISAWEQSSGLVDEHWILGFVVSDEEIYSSLFAARKDLRRGMTKTLISQVGVGLGSLVVVLLGILLVARRMTSGLTALSEAARKMKNQDYGVRVDIKSRDEIGQLGKSFNSMASEIQNYTEDLEGLVRERTVELEAANQEISTLNEMLTAENVRLSSEIEVARRLQMMVLPKSDELVAVRRMGLQVAGYMEPADEVGGDYYDVLQSDAGVKIGVGDVTGHGLESGVVMLMVQTITRTLQEVGIEDPYKFLSTLNAVLYKNIQRIGTDKNLTLFFADYPGGNELIVSGQHEEVIVVHGNGGFERIDTMDLGFMVGLEPDISPFVNTCRLKVKDDDVVVFFTDGVTEADNPQQEQFGIDRLCDSIVRWRHLNAEEIKEHVIEDLMAFIGDSKIYDDITLLVMKLA